MKSTQKTFKQTKFIDQKPASIIWMINVGVKWPKYLQSVSGLGKNQTTGIYLKTITHSRRVCDHVMQIYVETWILNAANICYTSTNWRPDLWESTSLLGSNPSRYFTRNEALIKKNLPNVSVLYKVWYQSLMWLSLWTLKTFAFSFFCWKQVLLPHINSQAFWRTNNNLSLFWSFCGRSVELLEFSAKLLLRNKASERLDKDTGRKKRLKTKKLSQNKWWWLLSS